ncbi:MAG: DUF2791 family P-loop domain-containing protein, partial [Clostridia bacterium]|nr:DUF2791 family P-loop domain-containing protein [Clostridia bacterium]
SGAPYIAIGRKEEINSLLDNLDDVAEGGSVTRFLIGRYGSGKSFLIQLIRGYALERDFLTADCDLSPERKLSGSGNSAIATYRELMKNLALSLIPMIVLFIPMGEGKLLCDVFDEFLVKSNVLLVAFASIICGLILVISMWYTKESYAVTKRGADIKTVIRSSVYQLVSYVIPGFSHISSATTNMLICDVESKVVIREIYLYIAPQMFIVNLVKLIRYILGDTVINPIMIIISVIAAAVMSYIVVTKMSKINIRRILPFFAVYCIASGIIFCVLSLVL